MLPSYAGKTEDRNLSGIDFSTVVLKKSEIVEDVSTKIQGDETLEQVNVHAAEQIIR